ncbi:MAG TPA: hypothetical protein VM802_24485 [Chitinophaga sp.]|uniref:hypothetical protein n=1 Tax=Chitinophaga sp. TaxID=1869181 RepID=UPI002B7DB2CC|nr:hypothetical protein [Chitinophaga sp.]HVI48048.1 hypothetical protein [Chitinophaga sp.]
MQANNIFDPQRFGFYLRKHLSESIRFYLLSTLAITALLAFVPATMQIKGNEGGSLNQLVPFYYIGLFVVGLMFTARSFSELGHKEKGVDFLMLPASQFEKYLTALLITSVGFLAVYHVCAYTAFWLVDTLRYSLHGTHIIKDWSFFSTKDGHIYLYYAFIFQHAMFLLGATFFHKYGYIKTTLAIPVVFILLALINVLFANILFGSHLWNHGAAVPFVLVNVNNQLQGGTVYLIPESMQHVYIFAAKYLLAPIIWVLAYFRLKDKEI